MRQQFLSKKKNAQDLSIPIDETVTELQVPNELQLQLIPCRFCPYKFLYSELRSHAESCHPEELVNIKIYHCRVCGLDTTLMSSKGASQHRYESHPGENPYVCKYCNEAVSHIHKHVRYHCSVRRIRFPCEICDKLLHSRASLNRHVFYYHPEESVKLVPNCEICGRYFFSEQGLINHKRETLLCSNSGTNNDPEPAPKPKTGSETEMQPVKKEKRFECSTCEKKFFKSENLFRHIEKKHEENADQEQSYLCGVCDREFSNPKKLLSHHRKVHPEPEVPMHKVPKQSKPTIDKPVKRYICQLCNKKYKKSLKYKLHLQTHAATAEFPDGETE